MTNAELRELDAWIAFNVFNFYVNTEGSVYFISDRKKGSWPGRGEMPHYTTDLAAAMQVLEKCITGHTSIAINNGTTGWWVADCDKKKYWATGETLPLAICQFARKLFTK